MFLRSSSESSSGSSSTISSGLILTGCGVQSSCILMFSFFSTSVSLVYSIQSIIDIDSAIRAIRGERNDLLEVYSLLKKGNIQRIPLVVEVHSHDVPQDGRKECHMYLFLYTKLQPQKNSQRAKLKIFGLQIIYILCAEHAITIK